MVGSTFNKAFGALGKVSEQPHNWLNLKDAVSDESKPNWLLNAADINKSLGGVLVFSCQNELLYASNEACRILEQLQDDESPKSLIPNEIRHICQSLTESRRLFPDQNWLIQFDIFTRSEATLHIRSRWITVKGNIDNPCLFLNIEDRQQPVVNIILQEAENYGLTAREKDVWVLQHNNYTYKQIAAELGITANTVKKHVRSIHAKKKEWERINA